MNNLNNNQVVFTTKQIINNQADILVVIHDDEGDWQFFGKGFISEENAAIVSIAQIIEIDKSVLDVLNLPLNSKAIRKSKKDSWQVIKN